MADKYLFEAFQSLDELNEDMFEVTADGAKQLQDYVKDDIDTTVEPIIDPLAQSDEDLQDSYLGKVVLDCTICQSKIYKDPSEVIVNEDETLANVGDECPFCRNSDGYKIIGQIAPYSKTEVDVEVTPKEDGSEEAKVDLTSKEEVKDENLKEDLNSIQIDTDKETINVTATEKEEAGEEMITPIEDETKEEIKTEDEVEEPEYADIDIQEFDENDFDELGESYLKRVYENVRSYKTVKGSLDENKINLEGVITFKSGKQARTNFIFEASSTSSKSGKVRLIGENKQFARGNKSFTLTGKVNGNKLVAESLTYNYKAKDSKTGASKKLYGTVRK